MLILTRYPGEAIWIGDAKVVIHRVDGQRVRLGIQAPLATPISRAELVEAEQAIKQSEVPNGVRDVP